MTFRELVLKYKKLCIEKDIPSETVMVFLVELSYKERYDLYLNFDNEVDSCLLKSFKEGMERILNYEPMQHVLGYSWFYGYKFIVNSDVLIPRVETEELVSFVLNRMDNYFDTDIVCADIATGSGAIGISLKLEKDNVKMYGSDISEKAIVVAKQNALNNNVDVEFIVGDMLKPFIEKNIKLDVLLCNPPYIPNDETLESMVKDHEPHLALFGGKDGLRFYREIFTDALKVLKPKSFMAFEIGYNQRNKLEEMVKEYFPNLKYEFIKDISNKDRMLFIYV